MKMDPGLTRKRFRLSPLLFRRIHKWVGLILGLQFVLWTVSGAVMALLDMDKVGGHGAAATSSASSPWPADIGNPPVTGAVDGLTLRRVLQRPVYEVKTTGEVRLFDAQTGERVLVDAPMAEQIARSAFHLSAPLSRVTLLEKANLEARDHAGPMWRIDFKDADNSTAYVSAIEGRPLVSRSDTWRTWDFVWMLHNMDYVNRKSFNHPLIIFVAFGTLWLSLTGFYLLFKSFRRREFRWIIGSGKAQAR